MEAVQAVRTIENKGTTSSSGSAVISSARASEAGAARLETHSHVNQSSSIDKLQEESRERLEKLAQFMDDYVRSSQTSLQIQVHSGTGRIVVKVVSKEDGSIIREIPSEEALEMAAKMKEMAGHLFDEKV